MQVYVLEHVKEVSDDLSYYTFIGVYSSLEKALSAVNRLVEHSKFCEDAKLVALPTNDYYSYIYPHGESAENGFSIVKRTVNTEMFWKEGFVTC